MVGLYCGAKLLMLGGSPQNIGGFTDKSTTPLVVAGVASSYYGGLFGNQNKFPSFPYVYSSTYTNDTWKQSITEEFKQIATSGNLHVIGIKFDGTLWAWGYNANGQLGDGTTTQRTSPVQIGSDTNWASVAVGGGGSHTMAIKTTGTLWAWGYNAFTQLGDGTSTQRTSPVQIGSDVNWASVACGTYHTIAIKSTGTMWGWGYNGSGQNGTTANRTAPFQIGSDVNWASVSCGQFYTMAIKTTGTLWGWGNNFYSTIGDGTTTQRTSPVQIGSDVNWASVACGYVHTMAIKTTGTLYAWGQNGGGQFGETTNTGRGGKNENNNYRNVRAPMQVGTLINNTSSSTWKYAIPAIGSNKRDYDYYYGYYYDDDGSRIDPVTSATLAAAVIFPNARKTP